MQLIETKVVNKFFCLLHGSKPVTSYFMYDFEPLFTEGRTFCQINTTGFQAAFSGTLAQTTKRYCCDRYKLTNKSCFTEPPLCNLRFTLSISYSFVCSTRTLTQLIGTKAVNKCFCTFYKVNLSNAILYIILPSVHQGPEHYYIIAVRHRASCQKQC